MIHLLDGNVLVALVVEDHTHHETARDWFTPRRRFATCPITQGTLVRLLIRSGVTGADASGILAGITGHRRHEFWADDFGYQDVDLGKVIGHRQVTDAYLAQMARSRSARLVTFDRGVAEVQPDVAELLGDA